MDGGGLTHGKLYANKPVFAIRIFISITLLAFLLPGQASAGRAAAVSHTFSANPNLFLPLVVRWN